MSTDTSARAGLEVRQSHLPQADVSVNGVAALSELHSELVDGLIDATPDPIVAAVDDLDGDGPAHHRQDLLEAGVTALDGRLAGALATLAAATDPEAGAVPARARRDVVEMLRSLGTGHVDGQPSGVGDVLKALPPLLASTTAPGSTPVISVRFGVDFPARRRESRAAVLRFLSALAVGADVHLVTADSAAACIVDAHRADVPTWLLRKLRDRRFKPAHASDQTADDVLRSLTRSARPAGILRTLTRSVTDALDYRALVDALPIESKPYQAVSSLADDGLVEKTEAADGRTVVSLTALGADVGDTLASEQRRLRAGSSAAPSRSEPENPSQKTPRISPAMPCWPARRDGPPGPAGRRRRGRRRAAARGRQGDR